ncbi:unnamed protein product [Prorocentrum cordatum]|uniref:Uncharacterized protein n=1 Tax=Prorocentrum cordatum TaxID=2364126 RepID=A0ABN9QI56_9DINO|nr:unnamed protein product [Polarella glacialis]
MQKQLDALLKDKEKDTKQQVQSAPPGGGGGSGNGGPSFKEVLSFLQAKGIQGELVASVTAAQQREVAEHPPSVVTARWRVENLRKKNEKFEQQLRKLQERRAALDEEEAAIKASVESIRRDLSQAEGVYAKVSTTDLGDLVKITEAALDESLHDDAEVRAALAVLDKRQKAATVLLAAKQIQELAVPKVSEEVKASQQRMEMELPLPWGSNVRGDFDDLERFWDHNVVDVDWSEVIGFAVPSLLPRPVQGVDIYGSGVGFFGGDGWFFAWR